MPDLTGTNQLLAITETHESYLIAAALGEISAGTQASADFFNNGLKDDHPARVSRQTVWSWGNGSKRVSDSRLRFWKLAFPAEDPRHQLAVAIGEFREKETAELDAHWVTPAPVPVKKRRQRIGRDF